MSEHSKHQEQHDHHPDDMHDDHSAWSDDDHHGESGLGSTFVHAEAHESHSAPEPIIIERVMSDVVLGWVLGIDLDALRDVHSTHSPRVLWGYDEQSADLLAPVDEGVDLRVQKHVEVYHDWSAISTDLSWDLSPDVRVAAALREDTESQIVDARIVQPFTRESFDLFTPPSPSLWSRLGSIVSAGHRHQGAQLRLLIRRALIVLGVWHLIGVLSLMSVYIAVSSVTLSQRDSLTSRLLVSQYGLWITRLTLTPLLTTLSWLPGDMGALAQDARHGLRAWHLGVIALRELLSIDAELLPRWVSGYGVMTLISSGAIDADAPDALSILERSGSKISRARDLLTTARDDLVSMRSTYRSVERSRGVLLLSQMIWGIELYERHRWEIHLALGAHKPMRYLILNQNRDEIRATGWFPGSVVFVEIDRGRITQKASRDIYLYDWKLYPFQVTPPPGIRELTTNYGLRDANYDPILKNNIEVMSQFHERSGYESLDAIITIHQWLIEDLIGVIGPVDFPEISTQITPDNFSLMISSIVEAKFGKNESAKDILFVFEKHLTEKLQRSLSKLPEVVWLVVSEVNRGEIMMAWRDDRLSNLNHLFSGSPRAMQSGKNWFFPVFTSLSGNKSDRYIHRDITFDTAYGQECQALNRVTMTLEHTLSPQKSQEIERLQKALGLSGATLDEAVRIQGSGANISYTRLYLPKWSEITRSSSPLTRLDIVSDIADVYALRQVTTPRGKTLLSLEYSTPRLPSCDITPVMIRQSGIKSLDFTSRFR